MKKQEEAKKEVKPAEKNSAQVQSAEYVVAIETDSKPRPVSLEEREDDITSNINPVVIQVTQNVSPMKVTCMHMIEMHSRNKKEKRKLIVHALPWEMCMYVHARKCSYGSTFDQFEQTEVRRSTCIHEAGVLVAANSQRRVPVDY